MYAFAITALVAAAVSGFGAWQVQDWRHAAKEADRMEAIERDRVLSEWNIDVAAEGHEKFKASAAARERIVKVEVDRIVEKPVYSNVCLDDSGLSVISADIAARHAASQPAPAVPGIAKPDGKRRGGGAAVEP